MKKGFTLVELLAVILILGVVALITAPIINDALNKSEEKVYKAQIESIEKAARDYFAEHLSEFDEDSYNQIMVSDLLRYGYIDNDKIINPKTNEEMTGCVEISTGYSTFEYKENCY